MPNVAMNRMMSGWFTSGRSTTRSTTTASTNITPMASSSASERGHAHLVQADKRQRREHHHDALREVEHARRLEDQHEAQRDQRVEHARDQPFPDRLDEEIRRLAICTNGSMKTR